VALQPTFRNGYTSCRIVWNATTRNRLTTWRARCIVARMKNRYFLVTSLGALAIAGCTPKQPTDSTSAQPTNKPLATSPDTAPISPDARTASVIARIRKIVAEQLNLPPERVLLTSTWKQLGADSLDVVELVMAFEEEFHVEIADERAEAMKTVGDAVTFLAQQKK
jgi:acyl carrier protein